MRDELHLGPLERRDPKLPRAVYAYLSNPLLQENLSFIPLATCFDYAADPAHYHRNRAGGRLCTTSSALSPCRLGALCGDFAKNTGARKRPSARCVSHASKAKD